jgi:hypothetical protein
MNSLDAIRQIRVNIPLGVAKSQYVWYLADEKAESANLICCLSAIAT